MVSMTDRTGVYRAHDWCRFVFHPALWVILWTVLSLAACSRGDESAGAGPSPQEERPDTAYSGTIVAMGDSLTAGYGVDETQAYPALLEKSLRSAGYAYRVINAGVSGETSSGALSRVAWVVSSLEPDIVLLETGANDGLRGVDPGVLRKNLDKIVSVLKTEGIVVVLAGMRMLPNLGPQYTSAFERVYPDIAEKHAIDLIPFFLEPIAGDRRYNQPDGIHPTPEGYIKVVEHIYPYVLAVLKKHTGG